MATVPIIDTPSEGPKVRDKRILWIEFAVVVSFCYLYTLLGEWLPGGSDAGLLGAPYTVAILIGRILPLLFIVLVADGNLSGIGFRKPNLKWDLPLGAVFGGLLFCLHQYAWHLYPASLYNPFSMDRHMSMTQKELFDGVSFVAALPGLVLAVLFEETFFRGYVIGRLSELLGAAWPAILISALMFSAWHLYQGGYGWLNTLIMGLVFGLLYSKTKRLWPTLLAHAGYNIWALWSYQHYLQTLGFKH